MTRVFSSCWYLMGGDGFALAELLDMQTWPVLPQTDVMLAKNLQVWAASWPRRGATQQINSVEVDEGVSVARSSLTE